jgi:hypothetical protein
MLFPPDYNSPEEVDSDTGYPSPSFYIAPPQGQVYRIHLITTYLVTGAAVANRKLYLYIGSRTANMYYVLALSPSTQAASTTYTYTLGNTAVRESTGIAVGASLDNITIPTQRPIILHYPRELHLGAINFQAGDLFTDGQILLERFHTS